jgi:micrococcal nuclease
MHPMRRLALVLMLLALGACGRSAVGNAPASTVVAANAVVERVVDGDTIAVNLGGRHERVRLIGINTPESVGDRPHECFGKDASAFTSATLPKGTAVRLERDAEPRDDYGRLLAYVYRARDGLFVNLELARQGYAAQLTIPPNVAHAAEFTAAVAGARAANRGLWGRCGGPRVTLSG